MQIYPINSQKMSFASAKQKTSVQQETARNMYAIYHYKGERGLAAFEPKGLKKIIEISTPATLENEFMKVLDNEHLCTDFMSDRQMSVICDYFKDYKDVLKKHFIDTRFNMSFLLPPAWCYNAASFEMLNDVLAENRLLREFYQTPVGNQADKKEKFISDYLCETCTSTMLKKLKDYAPGILYKTLANDDGSLLESVPQKRFNEILYFLGIQYTGINSKDALQILDKYRFSKKFGSDNYALWKYLRDNYKTNRMHCEY